MSTANIATKFPTTEGVYVVFNVNHNTDTKTYFYPFSINGPAVLMILAGSDPASFSGEETDVIGATRQSLSSVAKVLAETFDPKVVSGIVETVAEVAAL